MSYSQYFTYARTLKQKNRTQVYIASLGFSVVIETNVAFHVEQIGYRAQSGAREIYFVPEM